MRRSMTPWEVDVSIDLHKAVIHVAEQTAIKIAKLLDCRVEAYVEDEDRYAERVEVRFYSMGDDHWGNERIADIQFSQLPGCCGVLLVHDGEICDWDTNWNDKGVGTIIAEMCEPIARLSGYSFMMCTNCVSSTNESKRFKAIITKFGWDKVSRFKNRRSGNNVEVYTKKVPARAAKEKK